MSVYHLKYRPVKIADLDCESARTSLISILSSKEMPQVFLFAGPKGSGKTSAARILAKSINCLKPKKGEACGECSSCKSIEKGGGMDIIEMDAASYRGIDDVRDLKEKTYLSPTVHQKKVFIIDEVHMMTREAFNALLKLLEEPPLHTVFVLCTTDPNKIPETVLSRLVRVDFSRGSGSELRRSIDRVIEGEGLKMDEEIIKMVVERSDGSFRNAQKILAELNLACGKRITKDGVAKLSWFWYGGYDELTLAGDLMDGDLVKILTNIEKIAESGVDMGEFRSRLVRYFHDQMLVKNGVVLPMVKEIGMADKDLNEWVQLLLQAGKWEKEAVIGQLPLQLAVIDFLKDRSKKPTEKPEIIEMKITEVKKIIPNVETKVKKSKGKSLIPVEEITKGWPKLLMGVRPLNFSVEAFLRAAKPIGVVENVVRLEVFYPFHRDKLIEEKNRRIVEKVLKDIFGVELLLECVLGKLKHSNEPVIVVENKLESSPTSVSTDIYDVAKEIFG